MSAPNDVRAKRLAKLSGGASEDNAASAPEIASGTVPGGATLASASPAKAAVINISENVSAAPITPPRASADAQQGEDRVCDDRHCFFTLMI
jgi:hypothetical protein